MAYVARRAKRDKYLKKSKFFSCLSPVLEPLDITQDGGGGALFLKQNISTPGFESRPLRLFLI